MGLGTVIVTGGSSGLGRAIAHAVRDTGGTPVVLDVNPRRTVWPSSRSISPTPARRRPRSPASSSSTAT
jgi:NAD(P)-dependent dehydrogenase (short-subunit alcohol dehydrogenase family)